MTWGEHEHLHRRDAQTVAHSSGFMM